MKKALLLLFSSILFFNCSQDNSTANNSIEFPQMWQLIKMSGSIANSETIGTAMEWQEYYFLMSDGTFKKSRARDGVIIEVYGTFDYLIIENENYLEFTYESSNDIIGNCSGEYKEVLRIISEITMQGTWSNCDGPGLEYELMAMEY